MPTTEPSSGAEGEAQLVLQLQLAIGFFVGGETAIFLFRLTLAYLFFWTRRLGSQFLQNRSRVWVFMGACTTTGGNMVRFKGPLWTYSRTTSADARID